MLRYIGSFIVLGLLAGCTGSQAGNPGSALPAPLVRPGHPATSRQTGPVESILYSFGSSQPDALEPIASLVYIGKTLYGGAVASTSQNKYGTIFGITRSGGAETVLHTLTKGQGTRLNGISLGPNSAGKEKTLYGLGNGSLGYTNGTVVKVSRTGRVTILYSFKGGTDGETPLGHLITVNGTLYGTTDLGGNNPGCTYYCGTVFSITSGGSESVLHRFGAGSDGTSPTGTLLEYNGTLYGTTSSGGTINEGTVFSVSPSGNEKVLYSFKYGPSDGQNPNDGLIEVGGILYGTTSNGGTGPYCPGGCGVFYSITTSGVEKVLHDFGNGHDGQTPNALTYFNGAIYGTTATGGSHNTGTVFRISPSGHETVIYNFGVGTDGRIPSGALIGLGRTLYGVTGGGGAFGDGTLFSITL
ncbi:MAG: hypothetical protein JO078_00015 [Candidatus Eremiobacteraeota bacterium]|nr:hypothetical protein [Candidatus Eremiobacteraeota bacterium]